MNSTIQHILFAFTVLALTACNDAQLDSNEPSTSAVEETAINSNHDLVDSSKEVLVFNGKIYTSNVDEPITEAFVIRDKQIVATGSLASVEAAFPQAEKLNLDGKTVVPGFIDAHGHLSSLGHSLIRADLMGTTNKQEIIQRLESKASELPAGQWLLGRGWDQNDWPEQNLPTAADLDSAFPDRPVWLTRIDGHAAWGNSAAMAQAQQDLSGDWQPEGGEIIRDEQGKATGVFIDNAAGLIESQVPVPSTEEVTQFFKVAMAKTAEVGLTSMHDAGTSLLEWRILQALDASDDLRIRVYTMANGAQEMLEYLCDSGVSIDDDAMLTARAIKLYSDGALGSRGAALLEDYSDAPGNKGLLIESEASLKQHADRAANCGLQVNIHAIGDRGNRVTLNVLESIHSKDNPGRHRIEHSQVIHKDDFERFKKLKLIASVQPTHATSDMYWAEDRVGAERIKGAYAWQTFNDFGIPMALGSDFPVELPDPLLGFYAAVSRQDAKGWPDQGWYPTQKLNREQALYGFTLGAAYAAFQEDKIGSIEIGKFADFVVLSNDIMTVPDAELLNTEILATYLNGKAIYQKR